MMDREILEKDIPYIRTLMEQVLGTGRYVDMSRMGGLTNHTYCVTLENGESYVIRIPGDGTEEVIDRKDELASTKLACELGVDAEMLYFGENGAKVTRYIENAVTMSKQTLHQPEHLRQVAEIFRKMHSCGKDTGVPFEVFSMAENYEKVIRENQVPMFADYQEKKAIVMDIKAQIDSSFEIKKVPCHNDPLCENWVVGNGRMYLIDWEYAGMNDGMWDLADVSIEAELNEEQDMLLLRSYLGREPDVIDKKHFLANKIYVDFLWTLWAKIRVPYDGQPMEDWAVERYTRMKGFIEDYQKL